jgi:hypothetical protein
MFYLPEYSIYEIQVGDLPPGFYAPRYLSAMSRVPDSEIHLPPSTRRLVWFVDRWSPRSERPPGLVEIELPYGRYLYTLPVGRASFTYAGYTFLRHDPPRPATRRAGPPGR